uniref:Uncharacterized protein n=1 Tax=Zea mays TaxID=4577 RepID=A0A804MHZ0_MAIZE
MGSSMNKRNPLLLYDLKSLVLILKQVEILGKSKRFLMRSRRRGQPWRSRGGLPLLVEGQDKVQSGSRHTLSGQLTRDHEVEQCFGKC